MKKRLLSAVLSAVMAASLLVGCGGAKKGAESASESAKAEKTEEKSGEAVTLDFWTIDLKANFGDFFNELIQKYEEENKGVKINWTDIPFADVQSKLVAAVAGGTAPDVVNLNTQMALTLAGQGALVDLNKAATEEQKSIYAKDLWESAKIGDSVYAFPWYASPDIMFYNKDLFEKAGMEVPKTFNDALKESKEFYDKTGAYLFQPDEFFNILFEENLPVLNKEGTAAAFNTPEVAELLKNYKQYTDEGVIPKNNWGSWDEALKLFESGKLAIVSSSGSSLGRIKDEAPDIYKTIAVSKPLTGANGLSRNPLMNLVVPTKSKHQEEAIKFANYITNDENQLAFCKKVSIFPSTTKASEDSFFTSDTSTLEGQASAMSAEASRTSKDFSLGVANQSIIQDAVNKVYQAVIINGEDIQKSLDQGEQDVNKLLKK
nr:extracellular solute-binding protein [uncultured Oribacterium sp.]